MFFLIEHLSSYSLTIVAKSNILIFLVGQFIHISFVLKFIFVKLNVSPFLSLNLDKQKLIISVNRMFQWLWMYWRRRWQQKSQFRYCIVVRRWDEECGKYKMTIDSDSAVDNNATFIWAFKVFEDYLHIEVLIFGTLAEIIKFI